MLNEMLRGLDSYIERLLIYGAGTMTSLIYCCSDT
jgi:hypothetical protein